MQRRLDLAAALVHEPRVLFLDEPTTGLDPVSRKAIWEEVEKLNDEGTTVFLTTQYLEEADQLADRVGIIDCGRIVAEGTPESLKAEIGNPHLELSSPTATATQAEEVCAGSASRCPPGTARSWSSSSDGAPRSRRSCARSTRPGSRSSRSSWSSRRLDDVFVAKTGYHLEGEDGHGAGGARVRRLVANLRVIGALGARSVKQTFRRPQLLAPIVVFPTLLLAIQTGGAGRGGRPARLPARSTASSTSCSPGR